MSRIKIALLIAVLALVTRPLPISAQGANDGTILGVDAGTPTTSAMLLGMSSDPGTTSTQGVGTTSSSTLPDKLDAHALVALDEEGWSQVSPSQLQAIPDSDLQTLSRDDLIQLLDRLHTIQVKALTGLLATDAQAPDGDAAAPEPLDPAVITSMPFNQLEALPLMQLNALDDLEFYRVTDAQRQAFLSHVNDARRDLQAKITDGVDGSDGSDSTDVAYLASWSTGRVGPNWKFILEHTRFNPWAGEFPRDSTHEYRGQMWKGYLEDNMPQGLTQTQADNWIRQQVGKLHDVNALAQVPDSELDDAGRNIRAALEKKAKEPSFWSKAANFLGCSLLFSLFDYVAFNAWPKNADGSVKWTYRAVQTTVQIGLTLHLLKQCGPMTAAAFNNNWGIFGDDYMFYAYGLIGKWLHWVPANTTWDGQAGFAYFSQQPDGSYKKAPWTTWVLRTGAHGFDPNNPNDTMNGPELLSNFTKGSWLTFRLLTMKDTPLKDAPFFQKYLSWLP